MERKEFWRIPLPNHSAQATIEVQYRDVIIAVLLIATVATPDCLHAAEKPNVLMIVVDDMNDWVGCLGGHPQIQTPNIDRLAQRGLLFSNAHSKAQPFYCVATD